MHNYLQQMPSSSSRYSSYDLSSSPLVPSSFCPNKTLKSEYTLSESSPPSSQSSSAGCMYAKLSSSRSSKGGKGAVGRNSGDRIGKIRGDVRFLVAAASLTGRGRATGFDNRHAVGFECWKGLGCGWLGCNLVGIIMPEGPIIPVPVGEVLRDLPADESWIIWGRQFDFPVAFDVIVAISCSYFLPPDAGCPRFNLFRRQFIVEKRKKEVA